jgi:hypothetical protein
VSWATHVHLVQKLRMGKAVHCMRSPPVCFKAWTEIPLTFYRILLLVYLAARPSVKKNYITLNDSVING